jgi:hypothetical protein
MCPWPASFLLARLSSFLFVRPHWVKRAPGQSFVSLASGSGRAQRVLRLLTRIPFPFPHHHHHHHHPEESSASPSSSVCVSHDSHFHSNPLPGELFLPFWIDCFYSNCRPRRFGNHLHFRASLAPAAAAAALSQLHPTNPFVQLNGGSRSVRWHTNIDSKQKNIFTSSTVRRRIIFSSLPKVTRGVI